MRAIDGWKGIILYENDTSKGVYKATPLTLR